MSAHHRSFDLTLSCRDAVAVVAAVTNELAAHGALIAETQHYREPLSNSRAAVARDLALPHRPYQPTKARAAWARRHPLAA